jgi:hypothetical protein
MTEKAVGNKFALSLDWWAVLLAVALAALVKVGVLQQVSW